MNTRWHGIKWVGRFQLLLAALVVGTGLSAEVQGTISFYFFSFNDNFANRGNLGVFYSSDPFTYSGSLSNATFEAGEPYVDGVSSGQTVWGTWTAPSNGIVTLAVEAETFSPLLTVYEGSAPLAQNPQGIFPGSMAIPSVFTNLSLVASNNYLIRYEDEVCGYHWRERNSVTFHVSRGQDYQICVDSAIITDASIQEQSVPFGNGLGYLEWVPVFTTNNLEGGKFIFSLHFTPAPANDDFVKRIKLSGTQVSTPASNAGATKESGEPDHLDNPGGSSVWYSWTAPASGRVTISTNQVPQYAPPTSSGGDGLGGVIIGNPVGPRACGAEIDQNPPPVFYPVFAAYTGTAVNSLTPANTLPMQLPAFPEAVEFDVLKGQTYQIAFDGNEGTTGVIPLCLSLTTPPPNSAPGHAIKLHGVSVTATGYNAGATLPAGSVGIGFPILPPPQPFFPSNIISGPFPVRNPPAGGGIVGPLPPTLLLPRIAYGNPLPAPGYNPYKAAWWSWTAPVSGTVTIDLTGSDYPFPITVVTEPSPGKPAGPYETGSGQISFEAVQGVTYLIDVGQYYGLTGEIKLSLQAPIVDLPANKVTRVRGAATLTYTAAPGEIVALLFSTDNQNWKTVQTTTVARFANSVQFFVRQIPSASGPYYRAIIFDRAD